jgi:hypothetical protein
MHQFKLFTPYWWALHLVAVAFFFWLGHFVHF